MVTNKEIRPNYVKSITISGIKGIPEVTDKFKLQLAGKAGPCSLAIFAPNACGKSSFADAIEYLFSEDGVVQHLGHFGEKGGKAALPHVLAKNSSVEIILQKPADTISVVRAISSPDPLPSELSEVISQAPVFRMLRQYDLRDFVVEMPPGEKYKVFAKWLGYERVRLAQDHLTRAKTRFAQEAKSVADKIDERERDIKQDTNNAVTVYDLPSICDWVGKILLADLMPDFSGRDEKVLNDAQTELEAKHEQALIEIGHKEYQKIAEALEIELGKRETFSTELGLLKPSNKLFDFKPCFEDLQGKKAIFDNSLESAENVLMKPVWEEANALLSKQSPKVCPVCETPMEKTALGSVVEIKKSLESKIKSLDEFDAAQIAYKASLVKVIGSLDVAAQLENIEMSLNNVKLEDYDKADFQNFKERAAELKPQLSAISLTSKTDLPSFQPLEDAASKLATSMGGLTSSARAKMKELEDKTSTKPFKTAAETIKRIVASYRKYEALSKSRAALDKIGEELQIAHEFLNKKATGYLNSALSALQTDMQALFHDILGTRGETCVPRISLEIAVDEAGNPKNEIQLNIKFYDQDKLCKPGGYLSESFQNVLGMSLFLASVRLFNQEFPFIVLDDVVSSFDAENRTRIAQTIAEKFRNFQILVTTHDRAFFQVLNDMCHDKNWRFQKIKDWDLKDGPNIERDYTKDSEVEQALSDKSAPEKAGNLIRQYMEDWLDRQCAVFVAKTNHKRGERNLHWTLGELWDPFIERICGLGDNIKQWLLDSTAYNRLKGSKSFANLLSHDQRDPLTWLSSGDAETLWQDFRTFKQLFDCPECGKQLVYAADHKKVICPGCAKSTLPPDVA